MAMRRRITTDVQFSPPKRGHEYLWYTWSQHSQPVDISVMTADEVVAIVDAWEATPRRREDARCSAGAPPCFDPNLPDIVRAVVTSREELSAVTARGVALGVPGMQARLQDLVRYGITFGHELALAEE